MSDRNGYCPHGTYVGGVGVDWMCGRCEDGDVLTMADPFGDLRAVKPDPRAAKTTGGVGKPKPDKNKRTKASPERIAEIRVKKCQECRLCGNPQGVNAHHLIPRSLGGVWTESNLVGLCGSGTTGCHGLIESRYKPACYLLRARLTDSEYAYVVSKKGEDFLERYYPVGKVA